MNRIKETKTKIDSSTSFFNNFLTGIGIISVCFIYFCVMLASKVIKLNS